MKAWIPAALLTIAGVQAHADNPKAPAPPAAARDAGPSAGRDDGLTFGANQITGRVLSYNTTGKAIVIDEGSRKQELRITDDTTVFVDGRLGALADLKEGQNVRAAYESEGEPPNLRWIEVAPAKQASATTGKAFVGHVAAIDQKGHQITLSHGDDRRTFDLNASTKVLNQGKPGSLNDLKEGQEIRAAFSPAPDGGNAVASQLEIVIDPSQDAAPKAPPAKTQPPETTY